MASNYPGAIDAFTNPDGNDPLSNPAHAGQHSDANDAIEAIETTLGVNPQGIYATVAARMATVDNAAASAASSASAAAVSASAALVSQLDAAQSSSDAEQWATKLVDPVEGSEYSAKYWAQQTASIYDNFDDRYLGAKSIAPTLDNDGNALLTGALYWNTSSSQMFVYTGITWQTLSSATIPQAISVNASAPALRVTQTGTGDALLVEDSANPDSTPFVVNASGNVGIGTTTPAALLDVRGATSVGAGSASAPALTTTGDLNTGIYFPAADTIAFSEGGVESVRITSTGAVGIGKTNPAYALDVNGTINASAVLVNGAPISADGGAGLPDVFFLMGA